MTESEGKPMEVLPLSIGFAVEYLDGVMEAEHKEIAAQWAKVRKHVMDSARTPAQPASGGVPERETWWLAERIGTNQYMRHNPAGQPYDLTEDVWHAHRFADERSAFEFIRLSTCSWAKQLRAIEHMFINKVAPSPASEAGREPVAWREQVDAIQHLVMRASLGSCDCNTKSPDIIWHSSTCRYATLMTTLDAIDVLKDLASPPHHANQVIQERGRKGENHG